MLTWTQTYTPILDQLALSALVAALPVIVLLGLLAFFRAKAYLAAFLGLISSLLIALFIYKMPAPLALMAAANGAAYGLFPIGWIVLCAIFVYDISVVTGKFEIVKRSIAGLAGDRRIQLLLVAFSFGAFIEGAAGFGTPVAISAAMLIGLGFQPLPAAGLALLGNTAPVAFGALGTPIIALSAVTGLPLETLSAAVGRQLPFFSLIVPFWLVWAMAGFKAMREVWPACLTSGLSFAIVQFLVSNYHGPWVVDIAGAIVSMAAMVVLLQFWQPQSIWRFQHENETESGLTTEPTMTIDHAAHKQSQQPTKHEIFMAWLPWILLSIFVFIWGLPQVKAFLNKFVGVTFFKFSVPMLHQAIFRTAPVVMQPKAEDAIFTFNWLSATGTSLLLSGILSGLLLRLSPMRLLHIFYGTIKRVKLSLLTIAAMLALSFTTRYAGLDATLGLAFASSGFLFPFFSPLLGWLGVALTGSDTSSNVLFGNLQQITAQQLGLSPILATSANSSGGVMGKMIDAQSIVVAGVATGQQGQEGIILRYVFFHSLVLAILVGILILLQAYVVPEMIPIIK
ncbi:MAG: L-lactate permease [candidate division KSB1 bacterium]|nr:L-lactate permease [candidate division KSB1 bacterium]MDZ7333642.1 L-lactate permease [candidate division KSB1 bacterium]MDZ7358129.1 L-lactate permease [candidate division KSB1 bacterium]MDZ7398756.1 L-lactate permease [candidate division KSB1 bacterium]